MIKQSIQIFLINIYIIYLYIPQYLLIRFLHFATRLCLSASRRTRIADNDRRPTPAATVQGPISAFRFPRRDSRDSFPSSIVHCVVAGISVAYSSVKAILVTEGRGPEVRGFRRFVWPQSGELDQVGVDQVASIGGVNH